MPIVKCSNFIDVYRYKAQACDANEMSGRTGRPDLSAFVNEHIVRKIGVRPTDTVVDVGCGDGLLLRLAAPLVARGIGVLPTDEEVVRARAQCSGVPSLSIVRGLADDTGIPSGTATKVVCNGVFVLLSDAEIEPALSELARITTPGGLVFVGEVPHADELGDKTYGDSILKWLGYVLWHRGVGPFANAVRQVLRAVLTSETFVIAPKRHYRVSPDDLIAKAKRYGLICRESGPHKEVIASGEEAESATRFDYLFEAVRRRDDA